MDRRVLHLPMLSVIGVAPAMGLLAGLGHIGWSIPTVALERVSFLVQPARPCSW